jgi:hypothetical protein
MDIKSYIATELEKGQSMEDIMASITASANAAEKEYEASRVKVKNYSLPMSLDNEILMAISRNEVTSLQLSDIIFYWIEKEASGSLSSLTPNEVDAARTTLAKELTEAVHSISRISKILSNSEMSDLDKLMTLGAEMVDMKLSPTKKKIKTDSEKITEAMRKLGF